MALLLVKCRRVHRGQDHSTPGLGAKTPVFRERGLGRVRPSPKAVSRHDRTQELPRVSLISQPTAIPSLRTPPGERAAVVCYGVCL